MRRVSSGISLDVRPQKSMETTSARQNRWRVWQAQFISIRLYIERSTNSTIENRPSAAQPRFRFVFTQSRIVIPGLSGPLE